MAIKLKNSKYFSEIVAAGLILLAVACFLAQYGDFLAQADAWKKDTDATQENLISRLLECNYIFYKDLREKTDGDSYTYTDLYLRDEKAQTQKQQLITATEALDATVKIAGTAETEATSEIALSETADIMAVESGMTMDAAIAQWKADYLNGIGLAEWETYTRNYLAKSVDYCVIDRATNVFIKNTGRALETLAKGSAAATQLPYVYYIMIAYDEAGNISNTAALNGDSEQSDRTLKIVQSLARGRYAKGYWSDSIAFMGYDAAGQEIEKTIHVSVDVPRNAMFLYALTKEQWEAVRENGLYNDAMELYSFYRSAVIARYQLFLCMIAVAALLVSCMKQYRLYEKRLCRMPLEAALFAGICLFFLVGGIVADVVYRTLENAWDPALAVWFPGMPRQAAGFLLNALLLAAAFTGCYVCVASLLEAKRLGVRRYLKERSLLLCFLQSAADFWKRVWNKFRREVLDIDLDKKMTKKLYVIVFLNFLILWIVSLLGVYSIVFLLIYSVFAYCFMKRRCYSVQEQYKRLLQATETIAKGNLQTPLAGEWGIFTSYKEQLSKIQEGFRAAVEEEVKSQRMKTELITNVSHDLKTPLTAMITYIDLLKAPDAAKGEQREYIEVLEKQSLRLKVLIDDLFEISKANSRNVKLNIMDVDIIGLMKQVSMEMEEQIKEARLEFRWDVPDGKLILPLDGEKTYRIFENLYTNIIKYALANTRVYIQAEKKDGTVRIVLKNISAAELPENPMELAERFVRGDASRNTSGSGLGLAIAKSFTQLQKGQLFLETDGDLFKAILQWQQTGAKND